VFCKGTEETPGNDRQHRERPGPYSNRASLETKPEAIPLKQPGSDVKNI
jgi:hypothetical protein